MGFKCCIPGCRTGYDSSSVSVFRLPSDDNQLKLWLRRINRINSDGSEWQPTSNHRVCALHFKEDDVERISQDLRNRRDDASLQRCRLKPSAVPSIFPNQPSYRNVRKSRERSTSVLSSSRLRVENDRIEFLNSTAMSNDSIADFDRLRQGLSSSDFNMPSGFDVLQRHSFIEFVYIRNSCDFDEKPELLLTLRVNEQLLPKLFLKSALIPSTRYDQHLSISTMNDQTKKRVKSFCSLSNILAYGKSLIDENEEINDERLELASVFLSESAELIDEQDKRSLLLFLSEQVSLCFKSENSRRFSCLTLSNAFLWHLTSNSAYKQLRDLFILPTVRRLQQLSEVNSVNQCKINAEYIRSRVSSLNYRERKMVLIIDEIYTAQRIEYQNGQVIGLTKDGKPAKTVLAFMIHSISSKYSDVVFLVALDTLNTDLLKSYFDQVILQLHDIVFIQAVSVDNHAVNRALYLLLSNRNLRSSIEHPTVPNERLFLCFDTTHNLKNVFNNWVSNLLISYIYIL